MTLHRISRRRLLGGLLTGLAAWLCPRSSHAAAPPLPPPADTPPTKPFVYISSFSYDYDDGIVSTTTYTYDGKVLSTSDSGSPSPTIYIYDSSGRLC